MLLVCPKPLVTNWQREFTLWAPELPLSVIEGEQARRRWQWQQNDTPIKIANYELLQRDRELVAELGLQFDLVVLDEAQRIKNRDSATSRCVRQLPRRRSWALTGTPIENSPQDLVGIFEFLSPGYLSDAMKPRRMGAAASDYMLRRTKDKVLTDLPPKMFRDADVELRPSSATATRLAEKEGVLRLTEMGDSATIQHVFELVLRLKQICNFDPATGESTKLERLAADLDEVAASGRKAIVFSQWVTTLETLAQTTWPHFEPLVYHGRVPPRQRDAVLEQFRDDPERHVMLLSYGAGGVGLNLQFAGYVFLFDRWWNPAVEDQAINRAHRIGAAEPVTVTRFLALDTIEQRIDQILREKREMFDTIFSDVDPQPQTGPDAAGNLRPVPAPLPLRPDRSGGVRRAAAVRWLQQQAPADEPPAAVKWFGPSRRSRQQPFVRVAGPACCHAMSYGGRRNGGMVGLVNSSSPGSAITRSWTCDTANRVSTYREMRAGRAELSSPVC